MELLTTPEPHLIPGYTGYCPRYRFGYGETYGKATHRLLLDPTIKHANMLVLSSPAVVEVSRPSQSDINTVNARFKTTDSVFVHPVLPGYEGFIPRLGAKIGQRRTVLTTEGLAEFERQQLRNKAAMSQLRKIINIQSGQGEPRSLEERLLIKSQFRLPLLEVRPECMGLVRNLPSNEQHEKSRDFIFSS